MGSGFAKAWKAANTLCTPANYTTLDQSTTTTRQACGAIKDGLVQMGVGATYIVATLSIYINVESNARKNCCNALPTGYNCSRYEKH